jgi:5-methylcytosine-specific restriction endonuclease McrA
MAIDFIPHSKICTKCGETKPLSEFYKLKSGRLGTHSQCKLCFAETMREYRAANPDKMTAQYKRRYQENKAASSEASREYLKANPAKAREYAKRWRLRFPEKVRERSKRANEKRVSTPRGRLEDAIRSSILGQIRSATKKGRKTFALLGYTPQELADHLEKQFAPGMTWENYGLKGWHVDHIIPLSVHNYSSPDDHDFKRAWALKNLQPLWASDNLSKSDRIDAPFQPTLI